MTLTDSQKEKVKKQLEFYFSDSNLYRDKFLNGKVASDPEGFVDVSILCTFSRMQALLGIQIAEGATVSDETINDVADAVQASETLVLSEDKRRVRRLHVLSKSAEEVLHEVDSRSLYAGPFPFDTSLDEIVNFFEGVSHINSVRMRRHVNSKDFKGSVFVEFCTPEEAQHVQTSLNLEFQGAPLVLEPKLEYMKRKEEERHARPNSPYADAKNDESNAQSTDKGATVENETVEALEDDNYEPGCLVKFDFGEDVEFGDPVTFGLVKDSFGGKNKGLEYVEYTAGEKSGIARFSSPTAAQEALDECDNGKRLIAGYSATLTLIQGEEEKTYMHRVLRAKAAAEEQRQGRQGGKPFKKGGPQRGKKRQRRM